MYTDERSSMHSQFGFFFFLLFSVRAFFCVLFMPLFSCSVVSYTVPIANNQQRRNGDNIPAAEEEKEKKQQHNPSEWFSVFSVQPLFQFSTFGPHNMIRMINDL